MKRIFSLSLALVMVLALSLPALAVGFPLFDYRDGNTYLETFILSTEEERIQNEFEELVSGKTTVIFYLTSLSGSPGEYIYIARSDNLSDSTAIANDNNTCSIYVGAESGGFWGHVYEYDGNGKYIFDSYYSLTPNTHIENAVILGGMGYGSLNLLDPISDYKANVEGDLYIIADLDESAPEEEEDGNLILGWLRDFWDTFKNFLIGLFIPSDGFFAEWYNEIKAAFDKKFGALTDLYNQLTGFFDGIDTTVSTSGIFSNPFLGDILGWLRPVLTGLVFLITMIFCYRKIISLISE